MLAARRLKQATSRSADVISAVLVVLRKLLVAGLLVMSNLRDSSEGKERAGAEKHTDSESRVAARTPLPLLPQAMSSLSQSSVILNLAAEGLDGSRLGRLVANTTAACDGANAAVGATINIVCASLRGVREKATRLCESRNKRLEWQYEEFDANMKLLEGLERQLCVVPIDDLDAVEESLKSAGLLLDEVNLLPIQSRAVFAVGSAAPLVMGGMSHVQVGVDVSRCVVSSPQWLKRGAVASVHVTCCDAAGDAVRLIRSEDVCVSVSEAALGWSASTSSVEDGCVCVSVGLAIEAVPSAVLLVELGSVCVEVPLKVCVDGFGRGLSSVVTCFLFVLSAGRLQRPRHVHPLCAHH